MNKTKKPFFILALLFGAASLGLFALSGCSKGGSGDKKAADSQIDHYTCGMHPRVNVSVKDYRKGDVNCPICNMKLIPVMKESVGKKSPKAKKENGKKKILFYRNPMNPLITSKIPAKDGMGMDYIPVYEEAAEDVEYYGDGMEGAEHVYTLKELKKKGIKDMRCPACGMKLKKISKEEADRLKGVMKRVSIKEKESLLAGVKFKKASELVLKNRLEIPAKVAYDPTLYSAQKEYLSAIDLARRISAASPGIKDSSKDLIDSAERKLLLLGMSGKEIRNLEKSGKADLSLILPAETAWIYGNLYENQLSWLKIGDKLKVFSESFPGKTFSGKIVSIKPVLNSKTRTLIFRAKVKNSGLKLKPEMYADVIVESKYKNGKKVLALPATAVLDTGKRKIIWIYLGREKYEARKVITGPESYAEGKSGKKFFPILSGLKKGEIVADKGNFLIDSQSQITGVSSSYGGALK